MIPLKSTPQSLHDNNGDSLHMRNNLDLRLYCTEKRRLATILWQLVQHRGLYAARPDESTDSLAKEQEDC